MLGTVITKKGVKLLAKLMATKAALTFTRISVGTGKILNGYDPSEMIDLVQYKMDGAISKCNTDNDTAKITMQISSMGIESGFVISEVGVYAEDPDEGEILYSYIDLSDDPQYIYAEGGQAIKFVEITLEVVVGAETKVTAYINPESMITRDELKKELMKKVDVNGDISEMIVKTLDDITNEFPIPKNGEKSRTFMGKVRKFFEDFNAFKTGIMTLGQLVNNCVTDNPKLPLSAAQGKVLMDLYTVLNTKIACGEIDLSAYGITSGQAVRINNVVIITFWHNAALPTGKAINTVALPDDFRPQANKVGTAVYMDSSSTIALGTSIVKPDGHIYLDSSITRVRIEATIAYTIK